MTVDEGVRAAFEAGTPKRLADLGGADFLRGRESEIARTVFMPELLSLVLAEVGAGSGDSARGDFVVACLGVPVGPEAVRSSDYQEALEQLASTTLAEELAGRCQDVLVLRVTRRDDHEVARSAAMGASLQIALVHADLRYTLLGALVRLKTDEGTPGFLRRAAKVMGIALSHWPDPSLQRALDRLTQVEGARDEALFELGMAALREGLDADVPGAVDRCFELAREHFMLSAASQEYRPDAVTYSTALGMLTALRRGDPSAQLHALADQIRQEVTVARAWSSSHRPTWPWMGAHWTELFRWQDLAAQISALDEAVEAARDPGSEIALRQQLLGAYMANRAVLKRDAGGVETFLRPNIEARLLSEEMGRKVAVAWLADERVSSSSSWQQAADDLHGRLDARSTPKGK